MALKDKGWFYWESWANSREKAVTYYHYWGKAQVKGQSVECHLLPYHNLDVAAVGWLLLSPDRPLTQRLAAQLSLEPEALRKLLVFWLGLHDIGKFSRTFQGLFQPVSSLALVPPAAQYAYTERHDRLGAVVWEDKHLDWLEDGTLQWPASLNLTEFKSLSAVLPVLAAPFFGHHGQPVSAGNIDIERFFCPIPARAGMNRQHRARFSRPPADPRTSGDEPILFSMLWASLNRSPHERG